MKTRNLLTIIVIFSLMAGCANSSNKQEQKSDMEETKSIILPPISDSETLCYEDDNRRIVGSWQENVDAYFITVQPKKEGLKSFTVDEANAFHDVVGDALVVSNGTGNIRDLIVYSLLSGEKLLSVDSFTGDVFADDGNQGFTFFTVPENTPSLLWDEETASWIVENYVPENLYNEQLESLKIEVRQNGGVHVAALRKVHVDINAQTATPLNEYEWQYVE